MPKPDVNLIREMEERERMEDEALFHQKRRSKCHGCEWGSWVGTGYFCMFRICMKEDPFYKHLKELQWKRSVMRRGKVDRD